MKGPVTKLVAIVLLAAAVLLLVLFLLVRNQTQQTGGVKTVATFYPLYDFAKNVGGDKANVTSMTPPGTEPHDFEPTPQQLAEAQNASIFIYNGADFEPWVDSFLNDFKGVVVAAGDGVELHGGEENPAHTEGEAEHGVHDPHFWLDPVLAQQIVKNIRDGLGKADPSNASYYAQRAADYIDKLAQLDQDIKNGLAVCKHRTVITSHDAFGYFAKRYNLNVVPIAGISPEEEPSAAKLAELSQLAKNQGIDYIFFESLVSPKLAETIAKEAGAKTAVFDTIEGLTDEDQQQGKDYLSIQRENLANLRTALACQ